MIYSNLLNSIPTHQRTTKIKNALLRSLPTPLVILVFEHKSSGQSGANKAEMQKVLWLQKNRWMLISSRRHLLMLGKWTEGQTAALTAVNAGLFYYLCLGFVCVWIHLVKVAPNLVLGLQRGRASRVLNLAEHLCPEPSSLQYCCSKWFSVEDPDSSRRSDHRSVK